MQRLGWARGQKGFAGGSKDLMHENNMGYAMIKVRPDGYVDELCSDIQRCPKLPFNLCQGI